MNASTAILVLSCDKYADIWPVFFQFFKKYWSDCPFPVYLANNFKIVELEGVKQILSQKKSTWSEELQIILGNIPEDNVILILEDYFIYQKVDNREVLRAIALFENMKAGYLRLACFPKMYDELWPFEPKINDLAYGVISKNANYRVSLQIALWNKDVLQGLLNSEESPWQFEIEGSKRADVVEHPFLCLIADPHKNYVHGPITYYCTALSAGKWMRGALKLCKQNKIEVDVQRPVETMWEQFRRYIYIQSPLKMRKFFDFAGTRLKIVWK
ncbi:MAG: hypothetical protein PSX36_08860 [bacterium]|nr:hypothetical protein [bacterium]